ncbi:hypothetical protein R4K52_04540 [Brachyspira pilosicoli]|uniref:Uncharacterized protein n=1 Tax=Brachyspira pilosicoli B2904 TaxID=1133568 RepID=J9UWM0_BRAPL|nr:hypothetical protein [Brachyspira pilosicoli]AFR71318.1 hypothetical protein B2904_orf1989 [Brachyspira pilosicoli B2904]
MSNTKYETQCINCFNRKAGSVFCNVLNKHIDLRDTKKCNFYNKLTAVKIKDVDYKPVI